ncbi:unnamed protein product [Cunninghamella echinulata]
MGSISSFDGSEKILQLLLFDNKEIVILYQKDLIRVIFHYEKQFTNVLDMSTTRQRDTDTWSVAATIDDQEFIISSQGISGGLVGLSIHNNSNSGSRNNDDGEEQQLGLPPMETVLDLDDHISTLTGDEDDKHSRSIAAEFGDDGTRSAIDFDDSEEDEEDEDDNDDANDADTETDIESDRDSNQNKKKQDIKNKDDKDKNNNNHEHHHHHHHHHHSHDHASLDKQYQRRHRQRQHHNVVNDSISAPPQPQPSFTPIIKSYMELLEENDILQSQIQTLRMQQKHQAQIINELRSLTECSKEDFDKAINLTTGIMDEQNNNNTNNNNNNNNNNSNNNNNNNNRNENDNNKLVIAKLSPQQQQQLSLNEHKSLINTTTTTTISLGYYGHDIKDVLNSLVDSIDRLVKETVDEQWQLLLEKELFSAIAEKYLINLPFGTDNQDLLNTAYRDQLRRFQSTLGASFSKWYRRQTVQSLSLNPATKEYFERMKTALKDKLCTILEKHSMTKSDAPPIVDDVLWNNVLHWSRYLSLELHGGEADVVVQPIVEGTLYDQDIMEIIGQDIKNNNSTDNNISYDRKVTFVSSPLFIDEDDNVLLPAKVLLEDV